MANNPNAIKNLKPFTKGDPRINRKGRPKTFDALRGLAQSIAHETAKTKDGDERLIDGHKMTVIESILRQWAHSNDPRLQMAFIEYAYGKPPVKVEPNELVVEDLTYIVDLIEDAKRLPTGK